MEGIERAGVLDHHERRHGLSLSRLLVAEPERLGLPGELVRCATSLLIVPLLVVEQVLGEHATARLQPLPGPRGSAPWSALRAFLEDRVRGDDHIERLEARDPAGLVVQARAVEGQGVQL